MKNWMNSLKRLTAAAIAVLMVGTAAACGTPAPEGEKKPEQPEGPTQSVSAPTIENFTITADTGAEYGKVNEMHKLDWTIKGDCTGTAVTVKKSAQAAAAADYEYTEQTKKIVFKTIGSYTVSLKASNGEKSATKSASVNITDFDAPVVTVPADGRGYVEREVDFAPTVTYASGDSKASEEVTVTFGGNAATADTDYTLTGGKFTPKKVGEYKITVSATSTKGKSGQAVWTYTASPVGAADVDKDQTNLATFPTENNRLLVESNKATDFVYTAQDYDKNEFDVVVSLKKGETAVENAVTHNEDEKKLSVNVAEDGDYTLNIKFTNKADSTKVSDLTWEITVKADIHAPELGDDPFDGTWNKLVTNIGLALYFDAEDDKANLTYSNVTYELVDNADGSARAEGAQIVSTGTYANHPYLIATAAGKITVKMTVSDGVNSVSATKEFTVETFTNHDSYFKSVYADNPGILQNTTSGVWVDGYNNDTTTIVCTKRGLIGEKTGTNASYQFSAIGFHVGDRPNYTITFDYTLLKEPTQLSSILLKGYKGDANPGNIWFNWAAGENYGAGGIDDGLTNADLTNNITSVARPKLNQTIKYKVEGTASKLSLSVSTDGGTTFTELMSRAGSFEATRYYLAFVDYGCALIENFTLA